jgi:hypothetical protein
MDNASTEPAAADGPASPPRVAADRYQAILHGIAQGFCLIQVLFDEHGVAIYYRFLEINAAFLQQANLGNPVRRTICELVSQLAAHWFQRYGEAARTEQLAHFEQQAQLAEGDYWYEVYALPSGPPDSGQVAVFLRHQAPVRPPARRP